jgi:hypothetical protein
MPTQCHYRSDTPFFSSEAPIFFGRATICGEWLLMSGQSALGSGGASDFLAVEGGEEAFGDRVVPIISFAAHALHEPQGLNRASEVVTAYWLPRSERDRYPTGASVFGTES